MEVSGRFAEVWEGLGGFGRVWEGLGGFGADWEGSGGSGTDSKGLGGFGRVWNGLGRFGRVWQCQKCVVVTQNTYLVGVGKVWGGLNGFGRFRESREGFGRVWECQNCITVENICLGEFRRIWADFGMPKVCNCYQIHRQRATQATQGAANGCQRVPEDDNMDPIWSPNGGGGRAVATDFFQEICRRI